MTGRASLLAVTLMKVDTDALSAHLREVQARIERACARAGRSPSEVALLPITKTVGAETIQALRELGAREVGENRVLDSIEKAPRCPEDLTWHLVGHLQTNKVRKALGLFTVVHSVDSLRLAQALDAEAARIGRKLDIYLEVNVSGEAAKGGLAPAEVLPLARAVAGFPCLRVRGLMTMAPIADDPERVRPVFRGLRGLRDSLFAEGIDARGLSMGMTQDFEVAIEEGATLVRIGTALFQGVET